MARPRPLSLRRRILALALLMLLGAAALLVVFISDYANRASDRAFDRLLSASALSIAGAVQIEDGAVAVELPAAAFAMMSDQERVFYAVEDASGQHVTGYPDLTPDAALASSVTPVFVDAAHNGHPVRLVTVGRLVSTVEGTGWVTVRMAETLGARAALAAEIRRNALIPVAVLTALALVMVWVVIGRTFAPLDTIDQALRRRRPEDLSALDVPVPVEVQRLVEGLNGFMARLAVSMDRMGGLVAEAAHQVRNPLAALRAQSEMALSEPDEPALRARAARIHDLAVEASHLVSQLLMDATISHRMDTTMAQPLSLAAMVDEVLGRLDPDLAPRVSGRIDPAARAAVLRGDRIALREALRNLIDNALTYGAGPVLVEVAPAGPGRMTLSVLDRGPGIAEADKPRLMQRFVRGPAGAGHVGSGLGLDIARRVALAHGGTLILRDREGGGLAAVLDLPLADDEQQAPPDPAPRGTLSAGIALAALLALTLGASPLSAQPVQYPARPLPAGQEAPDRLLRIAGTTDTQLFVDFIEGFQDQNPGVAVSYAETDSNALYRGYLAGSLPEPPDLLISSASDLQFKLANDGHAQAHASPWTEGLPDWAHWRDEIFGFTFEPAVIVYNPRLIAPGTQPRSHTELASLLEQQPERFRGRVATYDIARSGVGHLLATQDQQISSQFWRLASAFGRVDARLSDSSPQIIDAVASGELALAYNVLGSYALARQAQGAPIGVIVPDDYVLALTRTMLIPQDAPAPDLARAFVDFTLSPAGQSIAAGRAALGSIRPGATGPWTQERIAAMGRGSVQPIALRPVLLVGLDPQRRSRFLTTWQEIVAPGVP
ncbi:extracellular solute-binding protein [Paracoccus gahaiensis]|uniref:histidine kinase n=1 Tax=Paracoccus gahaiensis TaxID=1706839 RepID=A0A4U0R875_9RHOB|nr:extracellular solute-binding protein [Paracoccus gahaiensis]TJZ91259.1 extracellular solute-binding protein [Paracoccus gahaiensis]